MGEGYFTGWRAAVCSFRQLAVFSRGLADKMLKYIYKSAGFGQNGEQGANSFTFWPAERSMLRRSILWPESADLAAGTALL